jgi:hypothetical protein
MTLPASRNTTYAPGSQVNSADLNAIQDQIVAVNATRLKAGPRRLEVLNARVTSGSATFNALGGFLIATASFTGSVLLELAAGERLLQMRARIDPAAAGSVTMELHRITDGVTSGVLASAVTVGAALQTITIPALSQVQADDPGIHYLAVLISTTTGHLIVGGDYSIGVL